MDILKEMSMDKIDPAETPEVDCAERLQKLKFMFFEVLKLAKK